MRRLPVAILVSVASHGVALAWLAWSGGGRVEPPDAPASRQSPSEAPAAPAAADVEAIELVLLDAPLPSVAPVLLTPPRAPGASRVDDARPPGAAAPRDRRGDAPLAVAAGGREPAATAATDTTDGRRDERSPAPARSPSLAMRRPAPPELHGLSQAFIDGLVARTRPLAPPPDTPERLLEELAELRRSHGSVAQIAALNEQIARQDLKPSGSGTYRAERPTFTAKVDADGSTHLEDKPGALDIQDRLMRQGGIDPYAHDKLALLDRTRDQRVGVGERHRKSQLARAAELMQRNIDRLWATTPDLAERKRGLFALWDDCAETGGAELVAAADAARRLVIGAIRARLRGTNVYTPAELAELNATRSSTAVFAPYE